MGQVAPCCACHGARSKYYSAFLQQDIFVYNVYYNSADMAKFWIDFLKYPWNLKCSKTYTNKNFFEKKVHKFKMHWLIVGLT